MNTMNPPASFKAEALTSGFARGPGVFIEPLSFWGGYDAETGTIVEQSHPAFGQTLAGVILLMARAKGSSSSSSVLVEAIRNNTGPAGIVLCERDLIIAIGVIVANELYASQVPLVLASNEDFERLSKTGGVIQIDARAGEETAWVAIESFPAL
jgi:predicted aconitase with swiveling domain